MPGAAGTEYLYVLLRRAARELERLEQAGLARTRAKLRPSHVPVLTALLEASPLTPGELAARCELEPSTMTGLLRALEKEGLIEREKVARDQRTRAISLTPRGRAASRVAVRTRAWAQQEVLRALPREDAERLAPLIAQIAAISAQARSSAETSRPKNPRRARLVRR